MSRWIAIALGIALIGGFFALTRCEPDYAPPPAFQAYAGLPVSGTLADARRMGFGRCLADNIALRCRRSGVRFAGLGPFEAALDMAGSDGRAGFDHVTLWVRDDQYRVQAAAKVLRAQGWRVCYTGNGRAGDQMIHERDGEPVIVAIDLSYWMKRRLRIFPAGAATVPGCGAEPSR
jgi:catechol 2,3-dioxygenase-like lactoylglutathione lyase family enzyme